MKTGRRLLAMLLVLAMLLSNLPVGAIAAELEELLPEPTEALTETEQPTEAPVEETEAPETTAAPPETEAAEETTAAATEEAEETTEETEAPVVLETQEASAEAVMETVAEEENPPYLTFATVYEDENGLHVDTSYYGREFVNPYGSITRVAFFLNEYVDGEWIMTCVEVDALDDSISLELVDEAVDGADFYYTVTTNTAGVTSGVCYGDVTMNVGTWPFHFHFSTEASNSADTESLIYELDLDHLGEEESFDVYAVMFHEDFTWSNVRLSEDSQRFASLYRVSDSVYRISISGVARKHVMDNGYVMLEVLSTQTDNNTGDVNENGFMYLPIFMTPNPGLIMVGVGNEGYDTGYHENADFVSYQMMFCPGQHWDSIFYVREWDAEAGEMRISDPVDPSLLQAEGDLTFTVIDPAKIREGEEHGEYFVRMTTNTFDQDHMEIYVELDDGTRAGGVYYYTSRYHVAYYDSEVMSNDTFLGEYYVNPHGDSVLYAGFNDENCGGTHRGLPNMDASFGSVEATDTYGMYKITLSEDVVNRVRRGEFQWLYLTFDVDMEDGSTANFGAGIWLKANEEDFIPYLTNGWLEWSEEGLIEGEWHDNDAFDIVPGDAYPHIYYVHTWDSGQGCYVEAPVPADALYCDDGSFTIVAMPEEDYRAGEANGDCFVWVTADEWGHESEIYTEVDGVRSGGVRVTTYLPQLGFYSSEELRYDTFLRGDYIVNPEAEENAFYVGLNGDDWIIDGEPWLADENMGSLLSLEKRSDTVIKVTLTQEGIDAVLGGEQLWPGIQFNMRNTVDGNTQFVDFGGLCVRANGENVTPTEEGLYAYWLGNDGDGFYATADSLGGTNIAKYDEYTMYFYLKLWDGEQYVEIPVHPEHDAGIILNRIEDVKDGEENGEFFYAVSIADDALDSEQEVWVEYEGTRYTMPITSGLHGVAVYTTQEPSHDTRVMAPVDVEPFGENVVYLATNDDWIITDVSVDDWAAGYVDLEELSETVWSVTLTEAGINWNMSQWILDIGMNVDIRNVEDPNWTENHWMNVVFSRENLEKLGYFGMDSGDYEIIEGGYIHSWFTGEYGSDEDGSTWQIWDAEVLTDLPAGLTYDYDTNTLTMEDYKGEWMLFHYGWTDEEGNFWRFLPSDTLTIELIGDNSLVAENHHALDIGGGLNAVITGDGSLLVKTVNDFAQDEWDNARVYDTFLMDGGNLTIQGNASVTVEIAGEGNESCWDGDTYLGDRAGGMTALSMGHGQLYIKDNAYLETVIPEGAQRNGSEDVGEENAIWGERFPGGYRGIADTFLLKVMGGTLVTQGLEFSSGYHDDGTYWTNNYAQTGGEVIIQANGWNNILEEDGVTQHTHCEGFTVRGGATAGIWGGSLTVNVEATDAQLASSTYYEGIAVCGGELEIGGDAEITVTANHESGNLVGVYREDGTGELNITGGTLNVSGISGEGNGRLGIYLDHETRFTMSGGTVNLEYADFMNHGPAHITGGTINIGGMYLYDELYEDGFYPAWITGFNAGGPEFIIDGGEINITGGMFNAEGMVAMNGGTMNINGGGLNVYMAFGFDGGEINIFNDGSNAEANVLLEAGHGWPSLRVDNYMSIAGGEGDAPRLTICNTMDLPTVVINGTYHQMAGSAVDITHTSTERPAIWVRTQFDEDGNPMFATDEEGNVIRDEEGNEILLTGSFLMNDGELNVMNPGDADAELIRAMEADPHSFVQFRGGETNFDTAQLFWNGETHITENAVVEVKDALILANAGHLVMDDGTLLANEESAIWLGNAEMNGGKMELDNAMIEVNSGFRFNNGEIIINNVSTDEAPINSEAIFTSIAVNTYFAIGNPEDPNSNPKLTINHNLTRCPAVLVNGTMHLMAGSVEIHVPVTRAPAIHIEGILYDEEGNPLKTDRDGHPMGAEFLQNGGVLNIHAAEEDSIAGIIGSEGSVFFMNGGEANLNGTNFVMSGNMVLNDKAVMNINDGILRLYETASLDVNAGQLNMDCQVNCGDDVSAVFQTEAGSGVILRNNGAINVTSGPDSYSTGVLLGGILIQSGGELNIEAPQIGLVVQDTTDISGGIMNIVVHGVMLPGDNEDTYLAACGLVAEYGANPDAVLTISGGEQFITVPDGGQHDAICYAINGRMPIEITGGVQHLEGQYVYFGYVEDGKTGLHLAEDRVLYSLEDGTRPELLTYPMGGFAFEMFEDDNVPGDWDTGEGFDFVSKAVITTNKAGVNTTWEVNDGVLTFQSAENIGGMYDYSATVHAPWYWVRDFITEVEMDTHLGYIGSYAFNGLDNLTKLVFLGEAPNFAPDAFAVITADAYYPVETDSWTVEKLQDYGGQIAWLLNYQSVEVVEILTDKDVLFAGEKTTLTADLYPQLEEKTNVIWTLAEGDEDYATLSVKNNVATVTAKQVTEKHIITLYAATENGLALPVDKTLTVYPKTQSVSIFLGEEEVTGGKIKADLDDGLVLTASLNPNDAEEYLDPAVTWTVSGAATVDENGVVTFEKAGTVKVTATAGDGSKKKAVVTVTVLDMIENIELGEDSVTELVGGKTASFTAYDADTKAKLKTSQVIWSLDEAYAPYASITTAGKLTTKVVQEAVQVIIKATYADDPTVSEIHVVTICPAASVLQLETMDENGSVANVTGRTIPVSTDGYDADNPPTVNLSAVTYPDDALTDITWKTSSKAIATVDEYGIVTGTCKAGTVTITATDANSKKSASVKLNFGVFAQDVTITSTEKEILSGASLTLTAQTFPEEGLSKSGITWSLKDPSDKAYLSVTAAGVVKAKTVYGPTKVVLVASSKDGQASEEMTLTVLPKNDGILVIKSGEEYLTNTTKTLNFIVDKTINLTAHTLGTDMEEEVTWTSSSASTATVENGTVTFLKTGTAKITAAHADGRKAVVTLKAANLATGITIEEKTTGVSEGLTLAAGKTMNLAVASTGVSKVAVTWSLDNSAIATITSSGKLTASASVAYEQIVTVTARANDGSGAEDSVDVILRPQIQGIQIHGLTGELTNCTVIHDMEAEPVIELFARTFPAEAASSVTWKSSNAKVAEIDEDSGEITCVKPGTVTITATASDGSGKKATFKLTLVKKVSALVMSQTNAVLAGGKSLTLKADAGDATDKSVTWSMTGDTAYVTLSAKGVLKASAVTAPKTVYVTATANDGSGVKGYCTVTVYPATTSVQILYDGADVTGETLELQVGQTITLEGSSLPVSAASAYEWKSSGTAAEVEDGKVTGVTDGKTVTVTCTAADGSGKKATVKIKVVPAV